MMNRFQTLTRFGFKFNPRPFNKVGKKAAAHAAVENAASSAASEAGGGDDAGAGAGAGTIPCTLCRLKFSSGNALHKHLKDVHTGTHKKKR